MFGRRFETDWKITGGAFQKRLDSKRERGGIPPPHPTKVQETAGGAKSLGCLDCENTRTFVRIFSYSLQFA